MTNREEAILWNALAIVAAKKAKALAKHVHLAPMSSFACHLTAEGRVDDLPAWASFSGNLRVSRRGNLRFEFKTKYKPKK